MSAPFRRRRRLLLLTATLLVLGSGGWLYYKWKYPYGWSHCCDKQLIFALDRYAEDHGGAYPAGGSSPEASLSLLYPKYADANLLRGKTVPLATVQSLLDAGQQLGPETCGWHYVEGLRSDDDPGLALVWDKLGLGHNGERNESGGRTVLFVRMNLRYISGSEWSDFLAEQERLHAARRQNPKQ